MSQAVGKPVRVQWMREDEHGWEPKGPPQLITIRSGVDVQGHVTTWEYVEHTLPWTDARLTSMLASRQTGIKPDENGVALGGADGAPYVFTNRKSTAATIPWVMTPNPLRTANLRAPYSQARCFAAESQMDDMAAAAGVDPVEFRLRYLGGNNNQRVAAVLRAAADKAGWRPRVADRAARGRTEARNVATGRGVAISRMAGTVVAQIADVDVDRSTGKVTVKRVTVAHDCAIIVNPNGLENQIGRQRHPEREPRADGGSELRFGGRHEPELEQLPDHPVPRRARGGHRADRPAHDAATRRRRSLVHRDRGRDRQRDFRCGRRAAAARCRSRRTGCGEKWKSREVGKV